MKEATLGKKVETIIDVIADRWGIDRSSARTLLHKFVCRGGCGWFKNKKPPERFELDLTQQERERIEAIVSQIMEGVSKDRARKDIHAILCHPI